MANGDFQIVATPVWSDARYLKDRAPIHAAAHLDGVLPPLLQLPLEKVEIGSCEGVEARVERSRSKVDTVRAAGCAQPIRSLFLTGVNSDNEYAPDPDEVAAGLSAEFEGTPEQSKATTRQGCQ